MNNRIHVGQELRSITNLIKRYLYNSAVKAHCENFSEVQGLIIGYLTENENKDVFQKDIEEIFTVRRSTVTGILQSMEKNNLITRISVPYDARLKKIILTEFGLKIKEHIKIETLRFEEKITNGVSEEELDEFVRILKKLKNNLK